MTQIWERMESGYGYSAHIQKNWFAADVVLATDQSPEKMGVADIVITGKTGVAKIQIIFSADGYVVSVLDGEKSNIGFVMFAPCTITNATKTNVTIMEEYIVALLSEMEGSFLKWRICDHEERCKDIDNQPEKGYRNDFSAV